LNAKRWSLAPTSLPATSGEHGAYVSVPAVERYWSAHPLRRSRAVEINSSKGPSRNA